MTYRNSAFTAFAVLIAIGVNPAHAQKGFEGMPASPGQISPLTSPTGSDAVKPNEMRAAKMIGETVYDRNNQKVGSVQDIIVDTNGKVTAVVISVGSVLGIGGKNVAVSLADLRSSNNRWLVDRTEEQLKQAANYHLEERAGVGTSTPPGEEPKERSREAPENR